MVLRKRALLGVPRPDLCRTWNIHPQFIAYITPGAPAACAGLSRGFVVASQVLVEMHGQLVGGGGC